VVTAGASGSIPQYIAADDRGNAYLKEFPGSVSASIIKVVQTQLSRSFGSPITSSPVGFGGAAYFGTLNGLLQAVSTTSGQDIAGFPVDLTAAVDAMPANAGRSIAARPSLRTIGGINYVFVSTSDGYVVAVVGANTPDASNGAILWAKPVLPGASTVASAPVVTSTLAGALADAEVYVSATDTTSVGRVFKLNAETGAELAQSANLVTSGAGRAISVPSVNDAGVYVSIVGGAAAAYRLNVADLVTGQQVGVGQDSTGAPFMTPLYSAFPRVLISTTSGTLAAYNASNGEVVFQDIPVVPGGATGLSSPYAFGGLAYMAGTDGAIYRASIEDGSAPGGGYEFYAGALGATVADLVVDPIGFSGAPALSFGDSTGKYHKVLLSDPTKSLVIDPNAAGFTAPTIDATRSALLLGSPDGKLYRIER
jgi:outer membrane protein assembly factor BamB